MNERDQTIILECQKLAIDFARHVDQRNVEGAVGVFAEDATFERRGEVLRGHAAIRAAQLARSKTLVTRHVCANIAIDVVDGERATGAVSFVLFRHDHAEAGTDASKPAPLSGPEMVGEYIDEYRRTAAGWRIAKRVAKAAFRR
ncbi:nuclear transport factor 2 family protein [Reyranella sp. CPCC 100927]|uniref:nuclear transport factor 2 family protein n=1 Tax=Reyranella sp. CPCC 100927 TaxID=2599616 RepID=UPI0011B6ABF5|nr:nuclear transport factor 2 family protein [Reyranella sp. CPCC 100927]TWT14096.1 nuclear transport factor 2 family protein [Reyranella sp. CPCC 100927]